MNSLVRNSSNSSYDGSRTRSSLIQGLQANDQLAWDQMIHLYGPLVFQWGQRIGLKPADAADVMQEVFFSVSKAVPRFVLQSSRGTFRGWLWTITRRKAIDLVRRRPTAFPAEGGTIALERIESLPDQIDDEPNEVTDASTTLGLFHRGLAMIQAEFEPKTWTAFYRSAVEEQPTADIAADLSMSPAAVRKAKSRVLRRLRNALGDQWD